MEGLVQDPQPKRRKLSDGTAPELCLDLATLPADLAGASLHAASVATSQPDDGVARPWLQYASPLSTAAPSTVAAGTVQEDRMSLPGGVRADGGPSASTSTPSLDLQLPHFPTAPDIGNARFDQQHRSLPNLLPQQPTSVSYTAPHMPAFNPALFSQLFQAYGGSSAAAAAFTDAAALYTLPNSSDSFLLPSARRDGGDPPARVPTPPAPMMSFPQHNPAIAALQAALSHVFLAGSNPFNMAAALPQPIRYEQLPTADGNPFLSSSSPAGQHDGSSLLFPGGMAASGTSLVSHGHAASTSSAGAASAAASASAAATAAPFYCATTGVSGRGAAPGFGAGIINSTSAAARPGAGSCATALLPPSSHAYASAMLPGGGACSGPFASAPAAASLAGLRAAASATAAATAVSPLPSVAGAPTVLASAAGGGAGVFTAAPGLAAVSNGASGAASAVHTLAVGTSSLADASLLLGPPGAYTAREEFLMQAEAEGELSFVYVENDGRDQNMIYLTGLKNIFSKQLPNMPREYIFRLVLDRRHKSVALVKRGGTVMGGITYRAFQDQKFGEIAFCAVSSNEQVKGYGTRLMNYTKEYARTKDKLTHFLTYADNNAVGYFSKQGFTREITMPRERWHGFIKDYDGGTLMECAFHPGLNHTQFPQLIRSQRTALETVLRCMSRSHVVQPGLGEAFKAAEAAAGIKPPAGPMAKKLTAAHWGLRPGSAPPVITRTPVPICSIPGVREAGWTGPEGFEASFKLLLNGQVVPASRHNLNSFMATALESLVAHDDSWPFRDPVRAEDVPDYHDVIKNPIDLSLIRARLEGQMYYMTLDILVADVRRICSNCRLYNAPDTQYFKAANKFEAVLDALISSHVVLDRHE